MKTPDSVKIEKIIAIWDALQKQISEKNITKEQVLNDEFSQWAVTTPLYNIGELVYNISAETKAEHQDIQWKLVEGLRHRLVHDYDGINWNIIVEVLFGEMNEFVLKIKDIKHFNTPN